MKTTEKITSKLLLTIIALTFISCGLPDFEGVWKCKNDSNFTIIINKISDKTYELKLYGSNGSSVSGSVENDVLVINMFGNIERLSLVNENKLKWSGVFADGCNTFVKD